MKREPFIIRTTRITKEQNLYIKKFAKKNKKSEGAVMRMMVDEFMKHYK